MEGLTKRHLLREIPRPRPEKRAVTPFTEQDIKTLLAACDRSKPYDRPGKKTSDHSRTTGLRDRAIILLLLDTGIRAAELSEMQIQQVDIKNKRIRVMGKGTLRGGAAVADLAHDLQGDLALPEHPAQR